MKQAVVFSKKDWIEDLYETDLLKYLALVNPEYITKRDIINALATMKHKSKYGSRDGKEFEEFLKPVFELFREALNVEIISGSGNTDILCTMQNPDSNDNHHYKINIEAKTGSAANSLNSPRISRHLEITNSKYCLVVAPRFSRGTVLDLHGYNIVIVKAEALANYISKECLSNSDSMASFNEINEIIYNYCGQDITKHIEELTISKYGISLN